MTASDDARPLQITLPDGSTVSGLVQGPEAPAAVYVLAHGAGAGMAHAFMAACAAGLAARGVATLRFQFPYMERGSKRPDTPAVAHAAVRAAVAHAAAHFGGAPRLFAGGRSFGGRMSSQAQAQAPLAGVEGLVFLGFPLHPSDQPASTRGDHLHKVEVPMLFVQGTRDKLAEWSLIQALTAALAPRAALMQVDDADHAFHVPARSGRNDAQVQGTILDGVAAWMLR